MAARRAPSGSAIDDILGDLGSLRNADDLIDIVQSARKALRPVARRLQPHSGLLAVGFAAGVTAGILLWSRQQRTARTALFSDSPLRRLAALGYLSGQRTPETVRLLREYIRWERRPSLRRRAESVLRRVAIDLDS